MEILGFCPFGRFDISWGRITRSRSIPCHDMNHHFPSKVPIDGGRQPLPFSSPWLLAPMDGVTDACFRDLLMETHPPEILGGAFTEFVRLHQLVPPRHVLDKHLGPNRYATPVGLQFMGKNLEILKDSAALAAEMGVPIVDLNFGCPARGAKKGCVGSALLDFPQDLTPIINACVEGVGGKIPVTAKIRSGVNDDSKLEDIVRAVDDSGASLLTIHCRTKKEAYNAEAIDWRRIARARAITTMPICGNGGVEDLESAERMREETGCQYVMIGRAALANPWVFSGYEATRIESALFLLDYAGKMIDRGANPKKALARLKQMIRFWRVSDLVADEDDRTTWLRTATYEEFDSRLRLCALPS
jgi:tRNA-dihydrouridine synthase C